MLQTDEIIEMARQAGMVQDGDVWFSANNSEQCDVHTAELEAFAKLVAEAEKERIAKKIEQLPFGDTAQSFAIWVRNDT